MDVLALLDESEEEAELEAPLLAAEDSRISPGGVSSGGDDPPAAAGGRGDPVRSLLGLFLAGDCFP